MKKLIISILLMSMSIQSYAKLKPVFKDTVMFGSGRGWARVFGHKIALLEARKQSKINLVRVCNCLLYTSPSPRD